MYRLQPHCSSRKLPAEPSLAASKRLPRGLGPLAVPACAALLSGCGGDPLQSALHPASSASASIASLWWLLFTVCTVVFVLVIALLLIAIFRRPRGESDAAGSSPPFGSTGFVVVSGVVVPAIILVGFLIASLGTTAALRMPAEALTIRVIGHQWWWEFHYPELGIRTANEVQIPVGRPVRLELTSADVIHSFWVPRLNGKIDLLPGQTTQFWMAADQPGNFRGQCAEFCGVQHARMAFFVVALPPDEFSAWAAARQKLHPEPAVPHLRRGKEAFFRTGCNRCHTIRGTRADGKVGPELTHLGSRLTLGAGTIANTPGNLRGWIANSQTIKPGNKMPRMYVTPEDLHALAAYLKSLE